MTKKKHKRILRGIDKTMDTLVSELISAQIKALMLDEIDDLKGLDLDSIGAGFFGADKYIMGTNFFVCSPKHVVLFCDDECVIIEK